MRTLSLCLIIGLLSLAVNAQKSPVKFGDIPLSDLQMTSYDKDPSAAAVILADYGEAYLNLTTNGALLVFERHTRIKILKKEGLDWANASVKLWAIGSTEDRLAGLKASTYNLEAGKIIESKMPKESVFKEKFNKSINIQKFALPNVKEGSVIEYSYRINSEFYTNFPNWQFQYSIPVAHSEYWAMIPEFFTFEKYLQGYVPVTLYDITTKSNPDFNSKAHHWICKDVPAFVDEPYMTSDEDYVSKIKFALSYISIPGRPVQEIMGSWQKLNEDLIESDAFGAAIRGSGFLKKTVEEITAGMTDSQQKMQAIYNYVKHNFEWDGTKDMLADPLKKVFDLKKGTTGDLNILLASMLEKANFAVDMVLISTRDHGFIRKEYPMQSQFNYVVCAVKIDDKTILLDATEKLLPAGMLPGRCLNGEGLVISKTNHGWMKIDPKVKAKSIINADFVLQQDGSLKGSLNFTHEGYDALDMRKEYSNKGEEKYVKDFLGTRTWEVEKKEFIGIGEIDQSVKTNLTLQINDHISVAGDAMYINPFVVEQETENPFKLEKREYPVDYGKPTEELYMCKITIPEGYTVDELPPSKVLLLPGNGGKYVYNIASTGNSLTLLSSFQINKSLFLQAEYPNLREFYNQVVAKQAEQIVLKKKQ